MNWADLTSQQQWQTLQNMKVHGGHFAQRLGEAWFTADSSNSERLAAAFPDMVNKYNPVSGQFAEPAPTGETP